MTYQKNYLQSLLDYIADFSMFASMVKLLLALTQILGNLGANLLLTQTHVRNQANDGRADVSYRVADVSSSSYNIFTRLK